MSFEDLSGKVIDIAVARQQRDKGKEGKKEGRDFLHTLSSFRDKWNALNENLQKILDDPTEKEEDKVLVRRQIEGNKGDLVRILFTMGRYGSYDDQLRKIERLLRIFQTINGGIKESAGRSLQNLTLQLEDFRKVFVDYDIQEEVEKVGVLKERIAQGVAMKDSYVDVQGNAFNDVELFNHLVQAMSSQEEYDLFVVEQAKEAIEIFLGYSDGFKAFGLQEEVAQYEKMSNDLRAALDRYERRDI